jgi:protein TonB
VESGTPVTSFTSSEVDQPATVISQPRPRYPSVLQAAGLTGQVTIEFVIDTTGRVEPASVRIVASSHPGFESSATETILGSRFHPGKVRGMPVRQLFRQTVAFRLEP